MMNWLRILLLIYPLAVSFSPTGDNPVTANSENSIVYVGMNFMIPIHVEVAKGYHIQANKCNDEFLIPTTLEVTVNKYFIVTRQEFPPNKQFKLQGSDSSLNVYDGKFTIKIFLSSLAGLQSGKYIFAARLSYQACDSKTCLSPRFFDFTIPVEVKAIK